MSETGRKLRMGLFAASFITVPAFALTALAHDDSPYQGGGYYQAPVDPHVQAEQEHMANERHHVWHEERHRDEALRNGDYYGAWAQQQHINQERHHLGHEQEHVDHEQ